MSRTGNASPPAGPGLAQLELEILVGTPSLVACARRLVVLVGSGELHRRGHTVPGARGDSTGPAPALPGSPVRCVSTTRPYSRAKGGCFVLPAS
eukprot:1498535-Rhodomonas_salina.3